jgi:hypothetical protein
MDKIGEAEFKIYECNVCGSKIWYGPYREAPACDEFNFVKIHRFVDGENGIFIYCSDECVEKVYERIINDDQ